ncbi:ATP-grasp domain-containing protein [Algoriphagus kandeliae]|uniref:ATP-grasp domain-containing protein n=1 Tax=Algoriphagus kandeliae TaxID=2562278 RepID=A0A4Y9QPX2_9BACT|nr:ATP-grasp domain-containing protein [Algoriphagus kandeliae]TFV94694.1 ATP-grasp domain-containing protein [Algoriphagus kandeliae]
MNVLLTSVGRRNYLVEYFKEAVQPYGGKVFAVNCHEISPALYAADAFELAPMIHSEQYIPFLINFCIQNDIKVVIPLLDNDLPVLANSKSKFATHGIYVLTPDQWLADLANDKYKTFKFLNEYDFPTVPTFKNLKDFQTSYKKKSIKFPLIIKPRWGMGSLSVYEVEDLEELEFFYKKARKEVLGSFLRHESSQDPGNEILIMSKVSGDEYMLDVINDLRGNYLLTVVNKKLLRKNGETEAVETVSHPELEMLGAKITALTKHPLVMDVDVILQDGIPYILEFNPRFSGGYPFSHYAGINLPKVMIKWLYNDPVDIGNHLTPKIGTKSMKGMIMVGYPNPIKSTPQ